MSRVIRPPAGVAADGHGDYHDDCHVCWRHDVHSPAARPGAPARAALGDAVRAAPDGEVHLRLAAAPGHDRSVVLAARPGAADRRPRRPDAHPAGDRSPRPARRGGLHRRYPEVPAADGRSAPDDRGARHPLPPHRVERAGAQAQGRQHARRARQRPCDAPVLVVRAARPLFARPGAQPRPPPAALPLGRTGRGTRVVRRPLPDGRDRGRGSRAEPAPVRPLPADRFDRQRADAQLLERRPRRRDPAPDGGAVVRRCCATR